MGKESHFGFRAAPIIPGIESAGTLRQDIHFAFRNKGDKTPKKSGSRSSHEDTRRKAEFVERNTRRKDAIRLELEALIDTQEIELDTPREIT